MAEPGWYQDPDGGPSVVRWWDGQQWTDTRSTLPGATQPQSAPPPPPPPSALSQQSASVAPSATRPSRARRWVLGIVVVLVGLAILGAVTDDDTDANDAGAELSAASSEWNRRAGLVVAAYQDPAVSVEDTVAVMDDEMPTLEEVPVRLRAAAGEQPVEVERVVRQLADNYDEKIAALDDLRSALVSGSSSAELRAVDRLTAAGEEGLALACEMVDALQDSGELSPVDEAKIATVPC